MADIKKPLMGMSLYELKEVAKSLGMPAFTGGQMAKWLYTQHVKSIDEMTNISKTNRERLAEEYTIGCMEPIDCQVSKDGTIKYLFPTATGKHVETVYIPDHDRATLCVSSQVGCKMNCLFCQTGKQGFEESLTTTDILNQIYSLPEREKLTNIVFMGQGEPMQPRQRTEGNTANDSRLWLRLEPEAHHSEQRRHTQEIATLPRRE